MTKFGYRRAKGPEATIHAIVSELDRGTMEKIAAERELPIGRVAGEAIKAYCEKYWMDVAFKK